MELKYKDVFYHFNLWYWGESVDIVKDDGTAIVCVKFDEKTFPKPNPPLPKPPSPMGIENGIFVPLLPPLLSGS